MAEVCIGLVMLGSILGYLYLLSLFNSYIDSGAYKNRGFASWCVHRLIAVLKRELAFRKE